MNQPPGPTPQKAVLAPSRVGSPPRRAVTTNTGLPQTPSSNSRKHGIRRALASKNLVTHQPGSTPRPQQKQTLNSAREIHLYHKPQKCPTNNFPRKQLTVKNSYTHKKGTISKKQEKQQKWTRTQPIFRDEIPQWSSKSSTRVWTGSRKSL